MIFNLTADTLRRRGLGTVAAVVLLAFSTNAHGQELERVSRPLEHLVDSSAATTSTAAPGAEGVSSSSALPAAPSPGPQYGGNQRGGNQPGEGQYPHYGTRPGLSKIAFEAGGGFSMPTGSTKHYQNTGWNIKVGGGYKLTPHVGAMLDYDYTSFGVPSAILSQVNPQGGGSTHLWSLTLNPYLDYKISGKVGGYLMGGGGFYRKLVNFTQPFNSSCAYYDPYYGCLSGTTTQTVARFSNNAGGLQAGTGFTFSPSIAGGIKLFAEARYVWVDNQQSANSKSNNGYAPTNYRTEYIPVSFGVRF